MTSAAGKLNARTLRGIVVLAVVSLPAFTRADDAAIDFNRDIRPILSNACFQCHGPDADERKGGTDGLRLDTSAGALMDLGGYAAIVPGHPERSELWTRITSTDPDLMMPPPDSGKTLSPDELKLVKAWIQAGAPYAGHWSYEPPVRYELPHVRMTEWPRNEIDAFILARLEKEGLLPSNEADRRTLIRRVSLDLTGLPPEPEDVAAFVEDPDPQAYEHLVDRLLERSSYGEHWARMWLDLARYADSAGYADDPPRTIWLFRDYVIRSLNANKPFDQFTIEQIAGDLLPNPTEDQLIATAFHRNTLTNNEGGTNDEEFRNVAIVDRVNTTMAVWMGTTIACAQCHSHKYDPITQTDYFRFFAIFNNTADADRRDESPLLSVYTEDQQSQRDIWQSELAILDQTLRTTTPELDRARVAWEKSFPRDLKWAALTPAAVVTESGTEAEIVNDVVRVLAAAKTDTVTVTFPLSAGKLTAIQLEALPDESLPGAGPGHASGNFVVTHVAATLDPVESESIEARFVRTEIPGANKILSLAEVQVFAGTENIALNGIATQSSTVFDGRAQLAIDGNTDGRFEIGSTTHTTGSKNPWWELDLGSRRVIDKIALWNRTDPGTMDRLKNVHISLLDENRNLVWQKTIASASEPKVELAVDHVRDIALSTAAADYSQSGFDPQDVLREPDPKKGWAIAGATGKPHRLTFLLATPVDVEKGARLTLRIEQNSQWEQHTLGRFRVNTTTDSRAAVLVRTPQAVQESLMVPEEMRTPDQARAIADYYLSIAPALAGERKRAAALRKELADLKPVTVPICRELPADRHRDTRIQRRGNFLDLGEQVSAGTPAAFFPIPDGDGPDRLGLAHWLISSENPLTPRVIANRYWEQIFGIGLVATSEEFGSQGDLPSHPQLLDWLATELVRQNWDLKRLLRMLVTSATYRQSSRVSDDLAAIDPDNRLLARGPRFRLSAETIRDQALCVSGLLSRKMYGPPVKPRQPSLGLRAAFGGGTDWETSGGEDRYRRGVYTTWRRSNPYPSMSTFDAPNREVCTVRRVRTNTPLQALVTLNDPVYIEAAQALARRLVREGGTTNADRICRAFQLVLARPPESAESQRLEALFNAARQRFEVDSQSALELATNPLGPLPEGMNSTDLAAWTVVCNVLLNLDEALMKP